MIDAYPSQGIGDSESQHEFVWVVALGWYAAISPTNDVYFSAVPREEGLVEKCLYIVTA